MKFVGCPARKTQVLIFVYSIGSIRILVNNFQYLCVLLCIKDPVSSYSIVCRYNTVYFNNVSR